MSDEFDYVKDQSGESDREGGSQANSGSSVEYGPRFFGSGAYGYENKKEKKGKIGIIAVIIALAVVLAGLVAVGGVLLLKNLFALR